MSDNSEYQKRIKTYADLSVALFIASIQGDVKEMEALLDRGAGADGTCMRPGSRQQESILGAAVREDRREAAELLIKRGANVNMIGPDGRTALHIAARYGHADMTALLIKNGADRNMPFNSETVYDLAERAPQQAVETIKALLEGYNRPTLGKTFRDAAKRGNVKTLRVIAAKDGFDVEDADHNGNTALMMVAENAKDCTNPAAAIETLIELGANVEAENYFRETALSAVMAKKEPSPAAVRALIAGGADILRETLAGDSNYEAAVIGGHPEIMPIFEAAYQKRVAATIEQVYNGAPDAVTVKPIRLKPQPK
jgi:ankyrin repeat protein